MSKLVDPATDNLWAVKASRHETAKIRLNDFDSVEVTAPEYPTPMPQQAGGQYLLRVLENGGEIAVATENGVVSDRFRRGEGSGVLFVIIDEVGAGWAFERTYTRFHDWMHLNRPLQASEATKPPGKGWQFINVVQHFSIVWYRLRTWDVYQ
ncbi:hypothetical protein MCEMSEM23_02007 [Rhabdaerophilaceae bacterium]